MAAILPASTLRYIQSHLSPIPSSRPWPGLAWPRAPRQVGPPGSSRPVPQGLAEPVQRSSGPALWRDGSGRPGCPQCCVRHSEAFSRVRLARETEKYILVQYFINYRFYFVSCIFNKYPISVPGYNLGHHISFSCHVFLVTSSLQQFPSLPLFPMTLAVLKSACQIFCEMSFNLGLFPVFS